MIEDVRNMLYIDQDSDLQRLSAEACVRKVNMRSHGLGKMGVNEVIYGTKSIQQLSGRIAGWCQDTKNKAIIIFVESQSGAKNIYRYFVESSEVQFIYGNIFLDFNGNVDADIVDDMLYWTGGVPMKLNVEKALNIGNETIAPLYKYINLNRDMLTVIKQPPLMPLRVEYEDDLTVNRNHIRGSLYQFRYQYVYDDGEESVWSPISDVPLPEGESTANGHYVKEENKDNRIKLTYEEGNSLVTKINFAYRRLNTGVWSLFKTIDKYDTDGQLINIEGYVYFYGNEVTYPLDQKEVARLYHNVPLFVKHQRFINGTNLVYANYNEGYGNHDVSLRLTLNYKDITTNVDSLNIAFTTHTDIVKVWVITFKLWDYDSGAWIEYVAGDQIICKLYQFDVMNPIVDFTYTCVGGESYEDIMNLIQNELYSYFYFKIERCFYNDGLSYVIASPLSQWAYYIEKLHIHLFRNSQYTSCVEKVTPMNVTPSYPDEFKVVVLPIGDYEFNAGDVGALSLEYWDGTNNVKADYLYNFIQSSNNLTLIEAIITYYDNIFGVGKFLKLGNVIIIKNDIYITYTNDYLTGLRAKVLSRISSVCSTFKSGANVEVGIVYYDQYGRSGGVQGTNKIYVKTISEIKPAQNINWLTRNTITVNIEGNAPSWAKFYQLVVSPKRRGFFQYLVDRFETSDDARYVYIRLNDAILDGISLNSKLIYGYYTFNRGDRVRICYVLDGDKFKTTDGVVDMQILDVGYESGAQSYIKDDAGDDSAYIIDEHGNKIRKRSAEYLVVKYFDYQRHGLGYNKSVIEVYTPEMKDDENNVFFEVGDRYAVINSQHSQNEVEINCGDVYVRRRLRRIDDFVCEDSNFSDIYLSDAWGKGRANIELKTAENKWYESNIKHSKRYVKGGVNGLSDWDTNSIVLSSRHGEITGLAESGIVLKVNQERKSTSIYIGRTVFSQADGREGYVGISDKLLGTIMPSQLTFGTMFPNSIATIDTYQYFFDVFNGAVVRDSYNGPYPISNYGIASTIKDLSKEILDLGIDNVDVVSGWSGLFDEYMITFCLPDRRETIVFYEKENKWSHYVEPTASRYMWFGDTLLSHDGNTLWLENQKDELLYGKPIKTEVEFVSNVVPFKNKIFKNIQLMAKAPFTGEVETLVEGQVVMSSVIYIGDWVKKQGVWWANFRRDGQTPLDTIISSRLRGRMMRLKLKGTTGLSYVKIKSNTSEKS